MQLLLPPVSRKTHSEFTEVVFSPRCHPSSKLEHWADGSARNEPRQKGAATRAACRFNEEGSSVQSSQMFIRAVLQKRPPPAAQQVRRRLRLGLCKKIGSLEENKTKSWEVVEEPFSESQLSPQAETLRGGLVRWSRCSDKHAWVLHRYADALEDGLQTLTSVFLHLMCI